MSERVSPLPVITSAYERESSSDNWLCQPWSYFNTFSSNILINPIIILKPYFILNKSFSNKEQLGGVKLWLLNDAIRPSADFTISGSLQALCAEDNDFSCLKSFILAFNIVVTQSHHESSTLKMYQFYWKHQCLLPPLFLSFLLIFPLATTIKPNVIQTNDCCLWDNMTNTPQYKRKSSKRVSCICTIT